MPKCGMAKIRDGASRLALMLAALGLLSACVGGEGGLNVTKMGFGKGKAPAEPAASQQATSGLTQSGDVRSDLIADLQARRSILPSSGPYTQVAAAVTEAGAGIQCVLYVGFNGVFVIQYGGDTTLSVPGGSFINLAFAEYSDFQLFG